MYVHACAVVKESGLTVTLESAWQGPQASYIVHFLLVTPIDCDQVKPELYTQDSTNDLSCTAGLAITFGYNRTISAYIQ